MNVAGFRRDGRTPTETRLVECSLNTIVGAHVDGSATYSIGTTMVIASVAGPRECRSRKNQQHERAYVSTRVESTAFCRGSRQDPHRRQRHDKSLEILMKNTFNSAIQLHLYPRSEIIINVTIVQNDGGVEAAAINAATLALIDAGVPLEDYVIGCTAGFLDDVAVVDLAYSERTSRTPEITIAVLPVSGKIVTIQMQRAIEGKEFEKLLTTALSGVKEIHKYLKTRVRAFAEELLEST